MRWLLLFGLVCLPVLAVARPKVAVAPLEGDAKGQVAAEVVDAAGNDAKVTSGPDETKRAMDKIGASGELDGKAVKKLRKRLDVHVLIHGTIEKDGGRKKLNLLVSVRGQKTERISITFKSAKDKKFKRELRDELSKLLSEGEGNDDDDDDARAAEAKAKAEREERDQRDREDRDKRDREDRDKRDREDRDKRDRAKRDREREDPDHDERETKRHKKKRRRDSEERNAVTQAALQLGVGTAPTRRTLTYDTSSATPPPSVGTLSFSGRVEAELYPASFSTLEGAAANLGIAVTLDKTFGLGIDNPAASNASVAIDKLFVEIGARYRIPFGQHAIAIGASYYRRRYKADRAGAGATLDMPDVDYTAFAPGAIGRFALGPKAAFVLALDVPLMLDAGPIQSSLSYGPAHILAFDLDAGIEYRLAPHYALKAGLELSNIMVSFDGNAGTQSQTRMVTGATDRNLGAAITLQLLY